MTEPDRQARFEIEIFYNANTGQRELLDDLFDAIADLVFDWGDEHDVDLFMSGAMSEPISESPPETDPPPTKPLACEADSSSKHDITIVSLLDEVVVVCDTCHDEIGATTDEVSLDEILRCVDTHVDGPPDSECLSLPDGSCIAFMCKLHGPLHNTDPQDKGNTNMNLTNGTGSSNGANNVNVTYTTGACSPVFVDTDLRARVLGLAVQSGAFDPVSEAERMLTFVEGRSAQPEPKTDGDDEYEEDVFDDWYAMISELLGKRVRATLATKSDGTKVISEGILLGVGETGEFEVLEDDGFVHFCWPMLDIEAVEDSDD